MMPWSYSDKLCWPVITHYDYTHSSFPFQYRLRTMTTFFVIAVYRVNGYAGSWVILWGGGLMLCIEKARSRD